MSGLDIYICDPVLSHLAKGLAYGGDSFHRVFPDLGYDHLAGPGPINPDIGKGLAYAVFDRVNRGSPGCGMAGSKTDHKNSFFCIHIFVSPY